VTDRFGLVIGFDDAPFERSDRGDVPVVGTVFNGARLEGVLIGRVRRDGANAASRLAAMIEGSRFRSSLRAILVQGVTLAGFNVVDLKGLYARTGLPVVAVSRRKPDLAKIRSVLLESVRGGRRKWRLIQGLPPAKSCDGLYIQCVGLDGAAAAKLVRRFALNSRLPEPLRTAHLVAGALTHGESRHRA
jgi:hypothetical protein